MNLFDTMIEELRSYSRKILIYGGGVAGMKVKDYLEERTIRIAEYIVETGATVRKAAHTFGLSKSTVHKDMEERLKHLHPSLFSQVRAVLSHNKAVRHLRGGEATRRKYRANC